MSIDKAISIFAGFDYEIIKEAREKLKKAKDAAREPKDWCFHHTDENVTGERDHFPMYDVDVAKKTAAQLKSLSEIPNWWEGEDIEKLKQIGLSKITSRWGDKVNVSKIQAKSVKKKPTH